MLPRAGVYRSRDAILVANLGPYHETDSLLISERNFEALFNQSQGGVPDKFETYVLTFNHEDMEMHNR